MDFLRLAISEVQRQYTLRHQSNFPIPLPLFPIFTFLLPLHSRFFFFLAKTPITYSYPFHATLRDFTIIL